MTDTTEAKSTPEQTAVTVVSTDAGGATSTVDRAALEEARAQEAATAEGDELLAGKFKTQDDLVKGYEELQKKLGQQSQQPANEEAEDTPDGEDTTDGTGESDEADQGGEDNPYGEVVSAAIEKAGIDVEASVKAFNETGTLSDEDFAKFEEAGFPRSVVDAYLRGASAQTDDATALVQSQVDAIKGSVGGEEEFGKLQAFINTSYSAEEKQAYNEAVGTGDFEAALNAVNEAKARYLKDMGTEGKLHSGTRADNGGYKSEAEMLSDMKDPRYKTSQAFRDQVRAKIASSSFHVTR